MSRTTSGRVNHVLRARGLSVRLRLAAGATALFLLLSGLTSVVIAQAVRHRIEDRVRTDASQALESVTLQMEAGVALPDLTLGVGGSSAVRVLGDAGEPIAFVPMSGTAVLTTTREAGEGTEWDTTDPGPTKSGRRPLPEGVTARTAGAARRRTRRRRRHRS